MYLRMESRVQASTLAYKMLRKLQFLASNLGWTNLKAMKISKHTTV